jgi:hypothetical protein
MAVEKSPLAAYENSPEGGLEKSDSGSHVDFSRTVEIKVGTEPERE